MKAFLLKLEGTIKSIDSSVLETHLTTKSEDPGQGDQHLDEKEIIRWWEVTHPERQRT